MLLLDANKEGIFEREDLPTIRVNLIVLIKHVYALGNPSELCN